MTRVRPAKVRYYFDADVRGLGQVMAQVRPDVTYPGDPGGVLHKRERPPCPVDKISMLDEEWIPLVAAKGWLIITRDARIQDHVAELDAVRVHKARMIALAGRDAGSTWDQLLLLARVWPQIEQIDDRAGPFVFNAHRSGLRAVNLT